MQISLNEAKTIRCYILIGAWVALLMTILRIFVTNIILSGEVSEVFDFALTRMEVASNEGLATGLRIVSLITILSLFSNKHDDEFHGFLLFAGILAATSFSLVGHAGEVSMKYGFGLIPQGVLILHLIAVAFWVGALLPLRKITDDFDGFRVAKIMHRSVKLR